MIAVMRLVTIGLLSCLSLACGDDDADVGPARDGGNGDGDADADADVDRDGGSTTGGDRNPTCEVGAAPGDGQAPTFVRNLSADTGWFAAPVIATLDGDGRALLVSATYGIRVFDPEGALLAEVSDGSGRVYAPHVVADLEGDGTTEVVAGNAHEVLAYEWSAGTLLPKAGWPVDTTTAEQPPEVRGLAAADLDLDGSLEIVATTTQTAPTADGGAQVFAFHSDGSVVAGWPRYNTADDATRNRAGHAGFGCYGLNVGIGDIDDDPEPEVLVTYDNHHIQAFDPDGVALDAAPWFTNRDPAFEGQRLTWGQFIRWADPAVEENHYHLHAGEWPHPSWTEWLQWTASPPSVADLDGDGDEEVVGVPNIEMHEPYETQAFAVVVLDGAQGDGSRSAMRRIGWETLPRGGAPMVVDDYPPSGVPAPTIVDLQGDADLEIVVSLNDGVVHAFGSDATELWRHDYTHGKAVMFASESVVADLNQDGSPEVIFTTFGAPDELDSGNLVVLAADGELVADVPLPNTGENGNGNGAPAAPGVGDLDGDGTLEIVVQTFEHGLDVFTVPGSATNCLLWPTARGGPLRTGRPNGT
jgi:hypothetical protein